MGNKFYIYQYFDPVRKEPIYIGKGSGRRMFRHLKSKRKHPLVQRIQWIQSKGKEPKITILHANLTEQKALLLEAKIIKKIGRKDLGTGPLCNLRDSDVGKSGFHHTAETKEKMRLAKLGNSFGLGYKHTRAAKAKITLSLLGHKRCVGKHHSEETKKLMSRKAKQRGKT